jgi:hypothetical protein
MNKRDEKLGRHVVYISQDANEALLDAIKKSGLSRYELMTVITKRYAVATAESMLRDRLAVWKHKKAGISC